MSQAKFVFNKCASVYRDKFMNFDLYDDTYDSFCSLLNSKESAILEIGCGPGNITKYILSKMPAVKILATDFAPAMVQIAQSENPTADCRVMDCRNMSEIRQRFDGIICGFCIPYLSVTECQALMRDCRALLNKQGLLYLSFIEGEYERSAPETGSTGDSVFVYYYAEQQMKTMLDQAGYSVRQFFRKSYNKSSADDASSHLILIAQLNPV